MKLTRYLLLTLICLLIVPLATTTVLGQQQSGITSPASGSTVSGDVIVQGTAVADSFQKYELAFKLEGNTDDTFSYFDGGTSIVVNAPLGIWRTSGLEPGLYTLRLRVVQVDGNYSEFFAYNLVVGKDVSQGKATITPQPSTLKRTKLPATNFPLLALLPSPGFAFDNIVYILTKRELLRSLDGGKSWDKVNTWPNRVTPQFTAGAILDFGDHFELLLTTWGGELWQINPEELAWDVVSVGNP